MALFRNGNMLNNIQDCDVALITTNSFIKKDGRLVMGRGIAKQVRDTYEDIDLSFGESIVNRNKVMKDYLIADNKKHPKIMAFQVKYHWFEKADLDLIKNSTNCLKEWAERAPDCEFFLNFPGIGNGQLSRDVVLPIVELLPNNVTIWEF